jgi:hypothetical protein
MGCTECYEISLPACVDSILVKAGLLANANYTWVIEDKFGNKYSKLVTTDVAGFLTILLSDLPTGLLNPYAGTLTLTILNALGETVSFNYNSEVYECVSFSMFDSEGSLEAIIPDPADTITAPNATPDPAQYIDQTPSNGSYGLLGGDVDGINTVFIVSQGAYISGYIEVYLNGILQQQGNPGGDYTETNVANGTFTFNNAPPLGSVITSTYYAAV